VADATLTGDESGDRAGSALAPAGDRDGDGYDEFLLGAPLRDGRGAAWLVYGTGM
jgi:hypothetical protein